MKYLKLFENKDYFKLEDDPLDLTHYSFNDNEIKKILDILTSIGINVKKSYYLKNKDTTINKDYIAFRNKRINTPFLNTQIQKLSDDYYHVLLLNFDDKDAPFNFKCDQLLGLKKCLIYLKDIY